MHNQRAPTYDETVWHPYLRELLSARAPPHPGDAILDLCCGTGIVGLEAASRVSPSGHVVPVDFTEDLLDVFKAKVVKQGLRNVEFVCGDVEKVLSGRRCEEFDIVFCSAAAVWLDSLSLALRESRWCLRT
jgi:ubiquinone/menaquinone biosynthesis C-methylase UbiE